MSTTNDDPTTRAPGPVAALVPVSDEVSAVLRA